MNDPQELATWLTALQPAGLVVVSLLMVGFFSTVEQIILSLGTLKARNLKQVAGRDLKSVKMWVEHPSRMITAVVLFETLSMVTFVYNLVNVTFTPESGLLAKGATYVGACVLAVLVAEVIPRALTKTLSDSVLVTTIRVAYGLYMLTIPVVIALNQLQGWISHRFGAKDKEHPPITEEEIEYLLQLGQRTGVLEKTKKDMIEGVFEFDETKVREIMTPRLDIKWISATSSFSQVLEVVTDSELSRIPICGEEGIDHVVGILLVKDLIKLAKESGKFQHRKITDIMREPFFIPESKPIMEVFKDLKKNKSHMAIVVDEHGGTAGLVTMEDILEEIVGDIQDEYDIEEADIIEVEPGIYDVAGSCHIDEFISFFEIDEADTTDYSEEGIDTIGGYVTATVGELPEVGKSLKIGSLNVEVTALDRHRIKRLRVARILAQSIAPAPLPESASS
jgi:putative hemolysin